jgi:hypothetical protein
VRWPIIFEQMSFERPAIWASLVSHTRRGLTITSEDSGIGYPLSMKG